MMRYVIIREVSCKNSQMRRFVRPSTELPGFAVCRSDARGEGT